MKKITRKRVAFLVVFALLVSQLFPVHLHLHSHSHSHSGSHSHAGATVSHGVEHGTSNSGSASHYHVFADIGFKFADLASGHHEDATVVEINGSIFSKVKKQLSDVGLLLFAVIAILFIFGLMQLVFPASRDRKPRKYFAFLRPPLRAPPVFVA